MTHSRALYPKLLQPVDKYRALVLGDLAMSLLPAGEVEESVRLTAEAFDIGSQLGSYRVLQRVREVRSYLSPYRDVAAVRDLDQRMAGSEAGVSLSRPPHRGSNLSANIPSTAIRSPKPRISLVRKSMSTSVRSPAGFTATWA